MADTETTTPEKATEAVNEVFDFRFEEGIGNAIERAYTAAKDVAARLIENFKAGRRNNAGDEGRLQQIHDLAVDNGAKCPFMVTKDASGRLRWVLFSSTTFEDRDREIVSQKAQDADCAAMTEKGDFGPLRWWHVGEPEYTNPGDWRTVKAGPGLDIGDCDFSAMHGKVRIESGTFRTEALGQRTKELADAGELEVSIGFSHPVTEPIKGVFENTHTFERSILTKGNASNLYTAVPFVGKEKPNMDLSQVKTFQEKFGDAGNEVVGHILTRAEGTEKAAKAEGTRYKSVEEAEAKADAKEDADKPKPKRSFADMSEEEISAVISKMIDDKMGAMAADRKKEVDTAALALKAVTDKAEATEKAVTEHTAQLAQLIGYTPRAVLAGFRASQDKSTIRDKSNSAPAPSADPIGSLVDAMDGVYANIPGMTPPPGAAKA